MKTNWRMWCTAIALGLTTIGSGAQAQSRPSPAPRGDVAAEPERVGDLEDHDALDLLLAADPGPGHGGGPQAHEPRGRMGPGMHGGPGANAGGRAGVGLKDKLNLTDDQKAKLADIRDRRERAAIPIQGDLRIASLDLRKLMRADPPDPRAIDAQIDRIATLRASLQKSHVAGRLDARAVLTPAQQKQMREHHGAMMQHHKRGGRGMHGGRGMGM